MLCNGCQSVFRGNHKSGDWVALTSNPFKGIEFQQEFILDDTLDCDFCLFLRSLVSRDIWRYPELLRGFQTDVLRLVLLKTNRSDREPRVLIMSADPTTGGFRHLLKFHMDLATKGVSYQLYTALFSLRSSIT